MQLSIQMVLLAAAAFREAIAGRAPLRLVSKRSMTTVLFVKTAVFCSVVHTETHSRWRKLVSVCNVASIACANDSVQNDLSYCEGDSAVGVSKRQLPTDALSNPFVKESSWQDMLSVYQAS